ncbi:XdhC family protein [Aquirhabdus sp.]|uniref:XdhC family protein n=1 Tax=Aquirhabdus sp. TaxID=2824160 RepID=UPI00396CCAD2
MTSLLNAVATAAQKGDHAVLATVVKVEGSAYRRSGARMLISSFGHGIGTISGGCLEADVCRKAWWLTRLGHPVLQRYSTDSDSEGMDDSEDARTFGLGCNGTVSVLLQRLTAEPLPIISLLHQIENERHAGTIATVISVYPQAGIRIGDQLLLDPLRHYRGQWAHTELEQKVRRDLTVALDQRQSAQHVYADLAGEIEVFIEYIAPPRRLVVFGAGHDAQPLVTMAKLQGWHVTVIDSRPHFAQAERFPEADEVIAADLAQPLALQDIIVDAVVAVMTHSLRQDQHWLGEVLQYPCAYVGQLGPRQRTERLLQQIQLSHSSNLHPLPGLAALHYPIGLDIGGDTPESVALAILAEITAVLNQRSGGLLKLREAAIHPVDPIGFESLVPNRADDLGAPNLKSKLEENLRVAR